MNVYQVNGNGKLLSTQVVPQEDPSKVKVKVTHLLPTAYDVNLFAGKSNLPAPFCVGRAAIGVISDDRPEFGFRRGEKVILNPYSERKSDRHSKEEGDFTVRGVDVDGFFSDYVFMPPEEIIRFPEGVEEKQAIFTDKIAVALRTLHRFPFEKGDYIVILGSDAVGCIIAQLAIYFHLIPIVIDNDLGWLEKVKSKGIYYTIDSTSEVPYDRVREITGGRMAEIGILNMSSHGLDSFLFSLTGEKGKCIVLCSDRTVRNTDTDISLIGKKNLQVAGIDNGALEFPSAINLLVQHVLDLDGFIEKEVELKEAEIIFREMQENFKRYYNLVIKM